MVQGVEFGVWLAKVLTTTIPRLQVAFGSHVAPTVTCSASKSDIAI